MRGQLEKAVGYMHLQWVEDEKFYNPGNALLNKLRSLATYVRAGKADLAIENLESIERQLPPVVARFKNLAYLQIYMELEDAERIERAIPAPKRL